MHIFIQFEGWCGNLSINDGGFKNAESNQPRTKDNKVHFIVLNHLEKTQTLLFGVKNFPNIKQSIFSFRT